MSDVHLAATVMLLRDGPRGVEVLLLQRQARSGFMPRMWVFPGGRVDDADLALTDDLLSGPVPSLPWPSEVARGLVVAAARETLEEAGVWLGDGALGDDDARAVHAGRETLAGALRRTGGRLAPDRLRPWARWITPEGEGRRFDTAFFVAAAPGAEARHDDVETTASAWARPEDVLAGGFAAFPLAPPTYCALRDLLPFARAADALAAASARCLDPVQPVRALIEGRLVMRLPGDDGHPLPARAGLPSRLSLGHDQWEPEG